jgi:hypothetical protein
VGRIGYGYGSEFHLLRLLGRHRKRFSRVVAESIGVDSVDWVDFVPAGGSEEYVPTVPEPPLDKNSSPAGFPRLPDREYLGVDFLGHADVAAHFSEARLAMTNWLATFWATKGNTLNWDAIGIFRHGNRSGILLFEAKAHTGELSGEGSGATDPDSIVRIDRALAKTRVWVGARPDATDWRRSKYYQHANRLAALGFLRGELDGYDDWKTDTKLLTIYMCGDKHLGVRRGDNLGGDFCPVSHAGWELAVGRMYDELGIAGMNKDRFGVYELYINVVSIERC